MAPLRYPQLLPDAPQSEHSAVPVGGCISRVVLVEVGNEGVLRTTELAHHTQGRIQEIMVTLPACLGPQPSGREQYLLVRWLDTGRPR